MDFREPKFDKEWFEKHQKHLVAFANSRLGHWFLALGRVGVPRGKIMEIRPNHVSYDWEMVPDGQWSMKIQKKTAFFTTTRFQHRFLNVYQKAKMAIGPAIAWKLLQPSQAFGFMPAFIALTTSTFYPNPQPESTSFDGYVLRESVDESFGTIRGGNGTSALHDDSSTTMSCALNASATSNQFSSMARGTLVFDTSAIDDAETVTAAVFSLYGRSKANSIGSPDAGITLATTASNTGGTNSDYENTRINGTTEFASRITYANWTVDVYNDFDLNASGIANVSKTGVSKFAFRNSWDLDNSFGGAWSSSVGSTLNGWSADASGTSTDPKLVVTSSVPSPAPSVSDTVTVSESVVLTMINNVTVNDAITVTESVTLFSAVFGLVVNDAITVTESVTTGSTLPGISVSDAITVTESITVGPAPMGVSVFEAITVTESVTITNSQLGPISVNDAITVTDVVLDEDTLLNDIEDMVDTITVTESISIIILSGISVSDSITVSESVTTSGQLDRSVNDTITVTENLGTSGPVVHAVVTGLTHMRSTEQSYPLMMDSNDVN